MDRRNFTRTSTIEITDQELVDQAALDKMLEESEELVREFFEGAEKSRHLGSRKRFGVKKRVDEDSESA